MIDPFDAKSLARSAAANTYGQRRECELHWTASLDTHIQDDQLHSFFDIAEELLRRRFDSTYS